MSEFDNKPLGQLADCRMGETIISKDLDGYGYPIFSADSSAGEWGRKKDISKVLKRGSIVIGARGTIGNPRLPDHDQFGCTQTTIVVIPSSEVDPYYLKLALEYCDLKKIAAQQAVPMLSIGEISKVKLPIPSLPEQKKISEILLRIEKLIEDITKEIEKLCVLKKSITRQLTTKGIANIHFKDTKLGKLPKSWDVISVDSVANIIDPQPDHRTPPAVKNGIPYISSGDIKDDGTLDFQNCRKVSDAVLSKQIKQFNIYENAFIFGKIGTIGKPIQISSERKFCLSANIILITSKNLLNQRFLYQLFLSDLINEQVLDQTNTTSQPALGIKKVRNFLIPMPPEDEMIKICKILESIDENIMIKQKMLSKNKFLKSALRNDLLLGRKRVKV